MPRIQTTEVGPVELHDEQRIQTIEVKPVEVQDEQPSAAQMSISLVEVK